MAKALDVVGDRWTLLIVRELLIRGACRYTDLRNGLPGIATNLLADRLRELEKTGIVHSERARPPIATTLFRLTRRGEELEPILQALGLWGAPLLGKPAKGDVIFGHWIVLAASPHLRDHAPDSPPMRIELRPGDEPVTIEAQNGEVQIRPGAALEPGLVLSGTPYLLLRVLLGKLDLDKARSAGLKHEGDPKLLHRIQPLAV